VYYGSVRRYLGLLAAARESWDEASLMLTAAHTRTRALGAHPWVLQLELDLLRAQPRGALTPERRARAERLLEQAAQRGWQGLGSRCERWLQQAGASTA
jgi:hypothetical protein